MFTSAQVRGLVSGDFELAENMSIVRVEDEELLAIVRVLPPHRAQLEHYNDRLAELSCETII